MGQNRGIYIVANAKSEIHCGSLVYSIRKSGCRLPIRLIPFGGDSVRLPAIRGEVEVVEMSRFSEEAHIFLGEVSGLLTQCPQGFLRRFLGFFGEWDEFVYSDNDVVALTNWERLFDFLPGFDLVHADEEYTTRGKFNHNRPEALEAIFGANAHSNALTAGHFVARRDDRLIADMRKAIEWFRQNPSIPKRHDQAFMHIASLLGDWRMLNLCRPPHQWLSSWAGDYGNTMDLVLKLSAGAKISHLHYSGGAISYMSPISDLVTASMTHSDRVKCLASSALAELSGLTKGRNLFRRAMRRLNRKK